MDLKSDPLLTKLELMAEVERLNEELDGAEDLRINLQQEIERLKAELVIVENGAAACGRFVIAHKELALQEDPAAYLLDKATGVAERKGGSTPWLNDMLNGSIKERKKARAAAYEQAAKMADNVREPGMDVPPALAQWTRADIARAAIRVTKKNIAAAIRKLKEKR